MPIPSLFGELLRKRETLLRDIERVAAEKSIDLYTLRPNWREYFMLTAQSIAMRASDFSRKVGAVLVAPGEGEKGGRIISSGYNGYPAGVPSAFERQEDLRKSMEPQIREEVSHNLEKILGTSKLKKNKIDEIVGMVLQYRLLQFDPTEHAEANAIAQAARSTISSEGTHLYTTLYPCQRCTRQLISAGVTDVFYLDEYTNTSRFDPLLELFWKGIFLQAGIRINKQPIREEIEILQLYHALREGGISTWKIPKPQDV